MTTRQRYYQPHGRSLPAFSKGGDLTAKRATVVATALIVAVVLLFYGWQQAGSSCTRLARVLTDHFSPGPLQEWNPAMLQDVDRTWVHSWVRVQPTVPSLVSDVRRQLSMELAIGALLLGVPGDFVETGVYEGGTAILLCKVLERYDPTGKRILWAADSFQGLPEGTSHDLPPRHRKSWRGEFSSTEQRFVANLQRFQVPAGRIQILRGWFNETLRRADIGSIAYLRLDADLYASTMDALEALYDKVSFGGLVYVDDYNSFPGCKAAVDQFRAVRRISAPLQWQPLPDALYDETVAQRRGGFKWEAVWWRKL